MSKKTKKEYLKEYKREADHDERERPAAPLAAPRLRSETKRGIIVVIIFTFAVLTLFSLCGWAGRFGEMINTGLVYGFGWGRFIIPLLLFVFGYIALRPQQFALRTMNYIGCGLFILSITSILHLVFVPSGEMMKHFADGRGGGYSGLILSYPVQKALGPWAGGVLLFAILIVSVMVLFDISLQRLYRSGSVVRRMTGRFGEFSSRLRSNLNEPEEGDEASSRADDGGTSQEAVFGVKEVAGQAAQSVTPNAATQSAKEEQLGLFGAPRPTVRKRVEIPLDLLDASTTKPLSGDIEAHKEKIQRTLYNFGIEVEMDEVKVGPTVTQYTLKPAEGVKLAQITSLSNDLALALAAHPIRIEAPIPGKSLVGIEVPNQAVAIVKLKDVLTSREFKKRKSKLTIGVGKDVAGHIWLADVDPMPHLLVAGATGSGKSVCLNTILLSLLYQNSPDELKLILIDPKRVEFSVYNGIPHLITPVINEIDKTINALRWVVAEMDRRFQLLSKTGHRDIHAYNSDNGNTMPYLVVVIDELADLMSVAANEVEAAIIRLAQMARAVGIHLILATQRPSVDIITGLIKANITTRIAFSVASVVDSRTILDSSGAEKLLGRGDMLYISSQLSKPKRLQCAYVTDQEITRIASFLKSQGTPEYQEDVTVKVVDRTLVGNFEDMGDDELLSQAKDLVIKTGKASASLLQRRLRVGYARAARLLDIMEEQGVIGPGDGAKPREILVPRDGAPDHDAYPDEGTDEYPPENPEDDAGAPEDPQ
ncbi:MAG: DNA translocase FtsK 4TM domain-containing protein [Patescibacteria group bacterium]|nr:DNA translocase FtsK 4TM domain-containing protein [Patescibacteria group bacterium]MDD5715851.1 DNA translocase FtsK 4TM domain-containing protein [Patescibacteria group bacterium]